MSEDLYAAERENLIESDPIALVDELLELRRKLAETEYEYAMETTDRDGVLPIFDREWTTLQDAQERVAHYTDAWNRMGRHYLSARLVKRRKAGEIEYVA